MNETAKAGTPRTDMEIPTPRTCAFWDQYPPQMVPPEKAVEVYQGAFELHQQLERELAASTASAEPRGLREFVEQEAGFDCDNSGPLNPEPCNACSSCRARKVMAELSAPPAAPTYDSACVAAVEALNASADYADKLFDAPFTNYSPEKLRALAKTCRGVAALLAGGAVQNGAVV